MNRVIKGAEGTIEEGSGNDGGRRLTLGSVKENVRIIAINVSYQRVAHFACLYNNYLQLQHNLLAMKLKFSRVMALVAVEDQQPVFTLRTRRCMVVKVFDPIEAYSIGCQAVVSPFTIR